jgi:hypothetical protein
LDALMGTPAPEPKPEAPKPAAAATPPTTSTPATNTRREEKTDDQAPWDKDDILDAASRVTRALTRTEDSGGDKDKSKSTPPSTSPSGSTSGSRLNDAAAAARGEGQSASPPPARQQSADLYDPEFDPLGLGPRWEVPWEWPTLVVALVSVEGSFFVAGALAPAIVYTSVREPDEIPMDDAELFAKEGCQCVFSGQLCGRFL